MTQKIIMVKMVGFFEEREEEEKVEKKRGKKVQVGVSLSFS